MARNRAELEIRRGVHVTNENFFPFVMAVAFKAFGSQDVGITTVLPPLVERPNAAEPLLLPNFTVTPSDRMFLEHVHHYRDDGKHVGSKFHAAWQALKDGVPDKSKRKSGAPVAFKHHPLADQIARETEIYETSAETTIRIKCDGIEEVVSPLTRPGTTMLGLTPVNRGEAYEALSAEAATARSAVSAVSKFVDESTNAASNQLIIPFISITEGYDPADRRAFVTTLLASNMFPLAVELQPLEIRLQS